MSEVRVIQGRGVYYLPGTVACPLATLGSRGPRHSVRLALDDDHSRVVVDPVARRIVLTNDHHYARKRLIGDLLLLGAGRDRDGRVHRFGLHTRFDKRRTRFMACPHPHLSGAPIAEVLELSPYELVFVNRSRETVVLNPRMARKAATSPPLAERLGRALLTVRRGSGDSPASVASYRVAIGVGPFSRDVVEVELLAVGGERPASGDLAQLLGSGTWELRVTALARLPSAREYMGRIPFLLGLDHLPDLAERFGRLSRNEAVVFRFGAGKGSLHCGGHQFPLPDAVDVARAYLEFDVLGTMLAAQLEHPAADFAEEIVL